MDPIEQIADPGGSSRGGDGTNLLSVLINVAFGFVGGLMVFLGPQAVIAYGSKLAAQAVKVTGYGQQMAMIGLATNAAPYVVIAPIVGMVARQLAAVRSLKGFGYFAAAAAAGAVGAFFAQGYVLTLMGK